MSWRKVLKLVRRAGGGMARSSNLSLGGKSDGKTGSLLSTARGSRSGIYAGNLYISTVYLL